MSCVEVVYLIDFDFYVIANCHGCKIGIFCKTDTDINACTQMLRQCMCQQGSFPGVTKYEREQVEHKFSTNVCLVAKVTPPATVDPLSATSQRSAALELRVIASPLLAPRSTGSPACPRSWTLADRVGIGV